jgi:NAD(P)-dependent dehydrogenase (short-subunit alcohol dehydrogenase family)
MNISESVVAITGGASGLGFATASRLARQGAKVALVDLPTSNGTAAATEIGENAIFAPADVTDEQAFGDALDAAEEMGPLRGVVHCAGAGRTTRLLDKQGNPGSQADFEFVIRLNLVGSYNALRLGAARMAKHDAVDGERGAVIMTASAAAFEGQIGQIPYSAAKAGIHGMTIVAARDLASKGIRVCTIAPGIMDTPMMARLGEEVRQSLAASVPNPRRLGRADEYAQLAQNILENPYLNGETIRLDGAIRMAPR